MHHDHASNGARTQSPTGRGAVLTLPIGIQVLHIEALREVRAKIVAGRRLQGFAIAHHSLNRIGAQRAGKFLVFALASRYHRNGKVFFSEGAIDLQHLQRALFRLFESAVRGMAFLPQKFGCA